MKIAQVSPLYESVPPQAYGGTERVVSYLTEALVEQGHEVTLFASGDSVTSARLVAGCDYALRLDANCRDRMVHHIYMLELVRQMAHRFDIIHFHCDYLHFPISRRMKTAHATTLHGRLDMPELQRLYIEFQDIPLVSISESQRGPLEFANWQGVVHHGLPENLYRFVDRPEPYMVFVGRISPEKQVDHAIAIAKAAGMKLKVAAKVDDADRRYYEAEIAHLFEDPMVEFLGEIDEAGKQEVIGHATALLFPINWCEPFGLVMIESFACGTPVIAYRRGSVNEVMRDGVSGYVVEDLAGACEAVRSVGELDRSACRRYFEQRFTAGRMASDYVAIYERLAQTRIRSLTNEATA